MCKGHRSLLIRAQAIYRILAELIWPPAPKLGRQKSNKIKGEA